MDRNVLGFGLALEQNEELASVGWCFPQLWLELLRVVKQIGLCLCGCLFKCNKAGPSTRSGFSGFVRLCPKTPWDQTPLFPVERLPFSTGKESVAGCSLQLEALDPHSILQQDLAPCSGE